MELLLTAAMIVGAIVYVLFLVGPLGRASQVIADRRASAGERRRAYVVLWCICFVPIVAAMAVTIARSPS